MKQSNQAPYSSPEEQIATGERKLDELTDLVGRLLHEIGRLPVKSICEPPARELLERYVETGKWLAHHGYRL